MITYSKARALLGGLTPKQIEVLELLVRHQTTKDIARSLKLAPSTVDQRIAAVRDKWDTADRKATARRYAEILAAIHEGDVCPGSVEPGLQSESGGRSDNLAASKLHGESVVSYPLLELLDKHFGAIGRMTLVAVAALVLVMVLATSLGVANALNTMLQGS